MVENGFGLLIMEDNLKPSDTFSPSIFDQAKELIGSDSLPSLTPKETPTIEIDEETSKILVQVPFDIGSYLLKSNEMKLQDYETEKLGKLWRSPLQRLLGKYEDSDIAIAAIATLAIAGEKYFEYTVRQQHIRDSAGDAGEGKDKLHKVEAA